MGTTFITMNEKLKPIFLSLYSMVMADGIVSAKELETLYRIGRENYNLTSEEINNCVVSAGSSYAAPEYVTDKIKVLYEMAEIAWADGMIDETEIQLLKRYAIRMGFLEENAEEISNFMITQVQNRISFDDVIKSINS